MKTLVPPYRLSKLAASGCLLLLPLLYFYPAVTGEMILAPGDGWAQNLGVRVLLGRMLAAGQLPLWNPLIFAGTPLLASIYPGALYPPNWLFALLAPKAALNVVVITTYHVALLGTYLYARRIGCTRVGALLAGIGFSFGGFMIGHLGHTSRIAAGAWLPWLLLALEALAQQLRWRWVTLGALCLALQLFAGEPQMSLYTFMVAGSYGLFLLLRRIEAAQQLRFLGAALALVLCGTLLSLPQLLPERELLAQSERASISYEYFCQYALPPRQLLGLLFPYFFGGASLPPYVTTYWGAWGRAELLGYAGALTWALALVACLTFRQARGLTVFWAGWVLLSLALALGPHLPFELNRLLYQVPVYNLFRAPARHLLEFNLALGVLAGLGATALARLEWVQLKRACQISSLVLLLAYGAGLALYRFFLNRFVTDLPLPARAGSLANPEVLFPVLALLAGLLVVWLYAASASRQRVFYGAMLLAVAFLDAWSWGFYYEWRECNFNVAARLADPPAVRLLKEREPDLNVFRTLSHAAQPFGGAYDVLNYPNVSLVRGLQSVNGYDALRLNRLAALAGDMTLEGVVTDPQAFGVTQRGLDLLNVKYLLYENPQPGAAPNSSGFVEYAGIKFAARSLELKFSAGNRHTLEGAGAATELALVTALGRSGYLANGAPVLRVRLHTRDGRLIEHEVRAGRDTAEWAYDRPDVRADIKHDRATLAASWPDDGFQGHNYLARLKFARAEIAAIEIAHLPGSPELTLYHAALYDQATQNATPLQPPLLPAVRWRKLQSFGALEVYENLALLPRAWFVRRAETLPSQAVLQTIKSGQLPNGAAFDPADTVLIAQEDWGSRPLPRFGMADGAEVKLTQYAPQRIELQTRNAQAGFLVLSEIYYRGWEARVDDQTVPVERVNYVLRGVTVPPGTHRVEFVFRAHSFRQGTLYAGLGVVLLLAGALLSGKRGWL